MQFVCKSSLVAAMLFLVSAPFTAEGAPPTDRIQIDETDDSYRLSVPISQLAMTLPKGNWSLKDRSKGGGTSNPRYFYFEDKEASLMLSGWFEPERLFIGVRKLWEQNTRNMKKSGLP
jgi:hypothetical protein